jgi:hypothetical protein
MLIDHRMYEAVPAELVGAETSFVFGKHSGIALVEQTLNERRAKLEAAGVEINNALAQAVTEEIKRIREERAASSKSEETIELYESAMRRLSLTADDVIDIAIALARAAA